MVVMDGESECDEPYTPTAHQDTVGGGGGLLEEKEDI